MILRRKNLLRLGLIAGLAVVLSGCLYYPRYGHGPRPYYYAAPYDRGHGYSWRDDGRDHHWNGRHGHDHDRDGRGHGHGY